jgi:Multisubunit Na+/H+ antiporter, MnhB subunit
MDKDSISIAKPLAIVLVVAVFLIVLLPAFGLSFGEPRTSSTDDYYIENTQEETGSSNAVTAVVFDYRGFDTLGEATVLFIAVLGIIMLFRRIK